ncbi:MAG: HYExAFE family protein [Phycisphaerales bacterium]
MVLRRVHYEQAFEHYLRLTRTPYLAVDEARRTLLPTGHANSAALDPDETAEACHVKSFDFVVYHASGRRLIVDIKGRRWRPSSRTVRCRTASSRIGDRPAQRLRGLENWVTQDDVDGLRQWQRLFGPGYEAVLVFAYACQEQPADGVFEEVFSFRDQWYGLLEISIDAYARAMQPRSGRWSTWTVPRAEFAAISRPFSAATCSQMIGARAAGHKPCRA